MLQERRIDKDNKMDLIFLPAYCGALYVYSLMEKTETSFSIKVTESDYGCGGQENFLQESIWNVMTPDPQSRQTVHRLQWRIKWISKPFYGAGMERGMKEDLSEKNGFYTDYFKNGAINYLAGEPYKDPAMVDGEFTWWTD